MKVCELVYDYALGRNGIVVSGTFIEKFEDREIDWEWLVLYDNGELQGADTSDLKVIENEMDL